MNKTILVTGGAGFIGSAVIRHLIGETDYSIVNVDRLTYAGNLASLHAVSRSPRYCFERVDVRNGAALARVLARHEPAGVMHLAAETHVDRSIDGPAAFVDTNIVGTHVLLQAATDYWERLPRPHRDVFRFHHVSTDEVFGSREEGRFTEDSGYAPRSPYAASKAAADHLVRAWHHTYGLPVVISNCSNNYGPFQYPEKLIPLAIVNALAGNPLPVYGDGRQVRDWLHVEDHARALSLVLRQGRVGESYNVGGNSERRNIDVVHGICDLLAELLPAGSGGPMGYHGLVTHVADRPGHDRRYAMDFTKLTRELGWVPRESFESGLRKTVQWYLEHRPWWRSLGVHSRAVDWGSRATGGEG